MGWVKLLDRKPTEYKQYITLYLADNFINRPAEFKDGVLLWTPNGFQSIDYYNNRESYPIDCGVTHWYEVEEIPPFDEASKLLIETEVFFMKKGIEDVIGYIGMKIFAKYGNAYELVTTGIPHPIMENFRNNFKSNGRYKRIKNYK